MNKNRPMVDIGIDYGNFAIKFYQEYFSDDYLRKKDDDMDTFLDEQEFFVSLFYLMLARVLL